MNLEPETRKGYYISSEMKKVWIVEMKLLNKLLDVCKRNNLHIFAEGGTLLGAVREHGFIPWDDDIDLSMPREDFDKLQILAKDEFKSPFFWQSGYTDYFPNGMGKLRMDNTAAIERAAVFKNLHQGICVDIFPLDVMPDDKDEINIFVNDILRLKNELSVFCEHHYSLTDWRYNYKIFKKFMKVKKKGFHASFSEYENLVKKYKDKDYSNVSLIAWYYHERYLRRREWYKGAIDILFEDIMLPIPVGYHEILTKQYGNYMTPVQAPAMHDGFVVLCTNKSYQEFLPALRKQYKLEAWEKRKRRILQLFHLL